MFAKSCVFFLSQLGGGKNNLITCLIVHMELKGILLSNKVYLIGGKATTINIFVDSF